MRLEGEAASEALGMRLADVIRSSDVVALSGELGAGKTTIARGVLRGLGLEGEAASPSFPIVLAYEDLKVPLWHVDLYRIEDPAELDQLGLVEAREECALLIEWPERMGERLWPEALRLSLARAGEGARDLTALVPKAWEGRWPPR
jgi:tRNA threonylcarbamoyladenosine biosynthesis protein TsaE